MSNVPPQGAYLAKQCPVRAQNDALHPGAERTPVGAFLQHLFDQGNAFEDLVFAQLAAHGAVIITERDRDLRIEQTLQAVAQGAPIIAGGELPFDAAGRRAGRPDVLIAARSGGYRAADVKSHAILDKKKTSIPARVSTLADPTFEAAQPAAGFSVRNKRGNLLQLAHYQRMLEAAGIAAQDGSRMAAIIGKEQQVAWIDLDSFTFRTNSSTGKAKSRTAMEVYDFEFGFRLDVIATTLEHLKDPNEKLLVVPVRIPDCETCPWENVCLAELTKGDGDLSLLPGIGFKTWKKHRERGVTTRAQLAALRIDDPRYEDAEMRDLAEQIAQAKAWLDPAPFVLRPGLSALELPRGDIEIDVDLENDPSGRVYMWGCLRTENGVSEYVPFHDWSPLDHDSELAIFRDFWEWVTQQRNQATANGKQLRAYYFSPIETRYLRSLGESAGLKEEVAEFVSSNDWIDLHRLIEKQILTGTGLSLKTIAPLAGFEWDAEDAGGDASMVHYAAAVGPQGSQASRDWLLTYNRNDVEATLAIRKALEPLARNTNA